MKNKRGSDDRKIIIILSVLIVLVAVLDVLIMTGNALKSISTFDKPVPAIVSKSSSIVPTFSLLNPSTGTVSINFLADTNSYVLTSGQPPIPITINDPISNVAISTNEHSSIFMESSFQEGTPFTIQSYFYPETRNEDAAMLRYVYANHVSWPYSLGKFASTINLDTTTINDLEKLAVFYCTDWNFETGDCDSPWKETTEFSVEYNNGNSKAIVIGSITENYEAYGVGEDYLCGDVNFDGSINVGDVTKLVNALFEGAELPQPLWVADADGSGRVNIGDLIRIISHIFRGWDAPNCQYGAELSENPQTDPLTGKIYTLEEVEALIVS